MRFAVLMTVLVIWCVLAVGSDFDVRDKPAFTAAEIEKNVREDRVGAPASQPSLHFLPVLAPPNLDLERHVELHGGGHLLSDDGGIGFGGV